MIARSRPPLYGVRTGRWAEPLQGGLLLVGVLASVVHPLAMVALAVPLGVVAPTSRRAFVLSLYLAGLGVALGATIGSLTLATGSGAEAGWVLAAALEFWLGVGAAGGVVAAVLARTTSGLLEGLLTDRGG